MNEYIKSINILVVLFIIFFWLSRRLVLLYYFFPTPAMGLFLLLIWCLFFVLFLRILLILLALFNLVLAIFVSWLLIIPIHYRLFFSFSLYLELLGLLILFLLSLFFINLVKHLFQIFPFLGQDIVLPSFLDILIADGQQFVILLHFLLDFKFLHIVVGVAVLRNQLYHYLY